jgi:hypothetical protein
MNLYLLLIIAVTFEPASWTISIYYITKDFLFFK